jgi:hypothetical protein
VEASWSVFETPKGAKRTPKRAKRDPKRAKMTQEVPPEASRPAGKTLREEKLYERAVEKNITKKYYKTQ